MPEGSPPDSRGVVYVATGARYIAEARESAASVRDAMPGVPICLITDAEVDRGPSFDAVVLSREGGGTKRFKQNLHLSPYDRTLFLDTDTYVTRDVSDLFTLLDRFEIAANQISSDYNATRLGVPSAFPEMNSGVIAYRKTPAVLALFDEWRRLFAAFEQDHGWTWDQLSFRKAVYESDARVASIPIEYNFMPYFPAYLMNEAKILHGRTSERMKRIASEVNETTGSRVFFPRIGVILWGGRMDAGNAVDFWTRASRFSLYHVANRGLRRLGFKSDALLHALGRARAKIGGGGAANRT